MPLKDQIQAIVEKVYGGAGVTYSSAASKELARLEKELAKAESDIAFIRRKLDNPSFVAKAPAAVVEGEKAKLAKAEATREGVLASMAALQ